MGRFLVWGMAFGPRGRSLAPLWLHALVDVGRWRHDIVLLGDEDVVGLRAPRLRTFEMLREVGQRYGLPPGRFRGWTLNNLKSQIIRYVDVTAYDYVLYLDLDVLTNTDRLEGLVRRKAERGVVAVQEDCVPLAPWKLQALTKLGLPGEGEQTRWARRPICAGVIGFPTTALGLAALRDYHDACVALHFNWSDQAKLTALLNRKYDSDWEFFGDTTYGRREAPRYSETLVHFTGGQDDLLSRYYRSSLQLELPPSPPSTAP